MSLPHLIRKTLLLIIFITLTGTICAWGQSAKAIIPLGGNAWATGKATITDDGLTNWKSPQDAISIYFRVDKAAELTFALRLRIPEGKSKISVTIGKHTFSKQAVNTGFDTL